MTKSLAAFGAVIAITVFASSAGGGKVPAPAVYLFGPYTLTAAAAATAWQPGSGYDGTATWPSGFVVKTGDQLLQARAFARAPFTDGQGNSATFSLLLGGADLLGGGWSIYTASTVDGPLRRMSVFPADGSEVTQGGSVTVQIGQGELLNAPVTGDIDVYFLVARAVL